MSRAGVVRSYAPLLQRSRPFQLVGVVVMLASFVVSLAFIHGCVPETNGKSLEEIEAMMQLERD